MSSRQSYHNQKSLVDINIQLDRDDDFVYHAGDPVRGCVKLKPKEGFKHKEVTASLYGMSYSTYDDTQDQHCIHSSNQVKLSSSKQPQEKTDSMMDSMISFERGVEYTYFFSFTIPSKITLCVKEGCGTTVSYPHYAPRIDMSLLPSFCTSSTQGTSIQVKWFIDITIQRPNNQSRAIVKQKLLNVGRKGNSVAQSKTDQDYLEFPSVKKEELSIPRTSVGLKTHSITENNTQDAIPVELTLLMYKPRALGLGRSVCVDCTIGIPGSTMRKLSLSPEAQLVNLERIKVSIIYQGDITRIIGIGEPIKSNVDLGETVLVDVSPGVNLDLRDCIPTGELSLLNCGWNHTSVELYNPDMHVLDITEFIPPLEIPHVLPSGLKSCCFKVYKNPQLSTEVTLSTTLHDSSGGPPTTSKVILQVRAKITKIVQFK